MVVSGTDNDNSAVSSSEIHIPAYIIQTSIIGGVRFNLEIGNAERYVATVLSVA